MSHSVWFLSVRKKEIIFKEYPAIHSSKSSGNKPLKPPKKPVVKATSQDRKKLKRRVTKKTGKNKK